LQDNNSSKPRRIIETYLTNTENYDSKKFKSHLAELHYYLESKGLKHKGNKLSFTSLTLTENPQKFAKDVDANGYIYKAEFKTSFFQALIVEKGGKTILDFKQPKFDVDALRKDNDFIKISDSKIRSKILRCYEEINPDKPINLVSSSKTKGEYIILHSENRANFINDVSTIAKGCINVLYMLRCMLFHGEIEPINANKPVYEHAYYLLRLIIKELH
jgi:hypothetical protein